MANLVNEKFFLRLIASGKLEVTKTGRAFNLVTGKELAAKGSSRGYRKLSWLDPKTGSIRQIQLHRLIWARFKGIPKNSESQINHKDGCKSNCRLSNLELTDNSGNVLHALAAGLNVPLQGEEKINAVFTDAQVAKFRKRFAKSKGKLNPDDLANRFTVAKTTVHSMLSGKTYSNVVTGFEAECSKLLSCRARRNSILPKDIKLIRRLRSLGESSYSIANELGIARNTVMKYW